MSNNHLHNIHSSAEDSHSHFVPHKQTLFAQYSSFLIIFAGFLVFGMILGIAYLPNRGPNAEQDIITQRQEKLTSLRAKEKKQCTTYAWVDQSKGIVQIPVALAMELTVRELSAAQKHNPDL